MICYANTGNAIKKMFRGVKVTRTLSERHIIDCFCPTVEIFFFFVIFLIKDDVRRHITLSGPYAWNCVARELLSQFKSQQGIDIIPPADCPRLCYQYTDCETCLNSIGSEGGWARCVWSTFLQEVSLSLSHAF